MSRRRFMVNIDCATNEVVIDDEDFHYDARLNLTGDFAFLSEKVAYADAVRAALEAANIPNGKVKA